MTWILIAVLYGLGSYATYLAVGFAALLNDDEHSPRTTLVSAVLWPLVIIPMGFKEIRGDYDE